MVILQIGKGRMFRCNSIGARIWDGLTSNRPLTLIANELSVQYRLPVSDLERYIDAYTVQLLKSGLLIAEAM
jgi:hypothetical protein